MEVKEVKNLRINDRPVGTVTLLRVSVSQRLQRHPIPPAGDVRIEGSLRSVDPDEGATPQDLTECKRRIEAVWK